VESATGQRQEKNMSQREIIRAWKDEEYRQSLSETERHLLPEHPAGLLELTDLQFDAAAGGGSPYALTLVEPHTHCGLGCEPW
jgi:mersacidin/lichenicidin family type 2 lantibiotic